MKSPRKRTLLLFGLGLAATAGVLWWTKREPRSESAPREPPAPPTVARLAERKALEPEPVSARPAPTADPTDPWIELNNEATTDLTAGDLALAVEKLERCHAARPEQATFTANLTEALVRLARLEHERGDEESAVTHLARALDLASGREDLEVLQRMLNRWREEVALEEDDRTEPQVGRFELRYDLDRKDLRDHAHEVLAHLEQSYTDLAAWLGQDPLEGAPAIRVVLYEPEDFDRLTGLGDWAAGVFDGVVRVSMQDLSRGQSWRAVLVHELVHVFVHAVAGPSVPGWLNEGLAQILEGRAVDASVRRQLEGFELFSLAELAGSLAGWKDKDAIGRAYAESFLFVDYLRRTYGDEALRRMLFGLGEGKDPSRGFEEWSRVRLEVAFEDWGEELRR